MPDLQHTGTATQKAADAQQERIKAIMAETGLNFGDACNAYIEERARQRDATPRDWVHV